MIHKWNFSSRKCEKILRKNNNEIDLTRLNKKREFFIRYNLWSSLCVFDMILENSGFMSEICFSLMVHPIKVMFLMIQIKQVFQKWLKFIVKLADFFDIFAKETENSNFWPVNGSNRLESILMSSNKFLKLRNLNLCRKKPDFYFKFILVVIVFFIIISVCSS